MRTADLDARLVLVTPTGAAFWTSKRPAAAASARTSRPSTPLGDFSGWAASPDLAAAEPFAVEHLGAPAPSPRQVLAIGLNYSKYAAEAGFSVPDAPTVSSMKGRPA